MRMRGLFPIHRRQTIQPKAKRDIMVLIEDEFTYARKQIRSVDFFRKAFVRCLHAVYIIALICIISSYKYKAFYRRIIALKEAIRGGDYHLDVINDVQA